MELSSHWYESDSGNLPYLFSYPAGYEDRSSNPGYPLIYFLHGAGERGTDLKAIRRYAIPKMARESKDFPFFSVSPQCPPSGSWLPRIKLLAGLLDDVCSRYPVDSRRIYLTGLSMGGQGVWVLALENPQRYAALAPICAPMPSISRYGKRLNKLKDIPVWVFHGAKDDIVSIENSDRMVATLREMHAEVRYTIYPEAGHDSWTATYQNPELYRWFLKHLNINPTQAGGE